MIELLEHNKETYKKLCDVLSKNDKCALIQATGTGKSYIIGKYIEEHGNRILILVPSNSIGDAWEDLLSHVDKEIDVVTYQMFSSKCEEYSDYDIVVADEMHHLGSEVWGNKFVETYSEKTEIKIIGLTATEIRYLDNSRDMSEEIFDGIRVNGCDLKTAIQEGILPKFKYVSALYCDESDYEEFRRKADKITDDKLRNQLKGKLEICIENMVSIQQAIKENLTNDYKKIIIFLNGVKTKEEAFAMFEEVFPDAVFYDVDFSKTKEKNRFVLQSFKNEKKRAVLFAIDMLNEGIHVKGTDCVIMLRKTISPQVYFQQLGRCLSSSSTKMPIIFDFVSNKSNLKRKYGSEKFFRNFLGEKKSLRESLFVFKSYSTDFLDVLQSIEDSIGFTCLSEYEKKFIEENYSKLGVTKTANHLKRRTSTVSNYAKKLGLTKERRFYEEDEIIFLKENYSLLGAAECAKKIKRTTASVKNMASILGLKRKRLFRDEEKEFIKNNYSRYGCKKCAEILGKSERAVFSYARKNNLSSTTIRRWGEYEDCFLKENFKKMTNGQMAQKLGRTNGAVKSRLKRLKLSRRIQEE